MTVHELHDMPFWVPQHSYVDNTLAMIDTVFSSYAVRAGLEAEARHHRLPLKTQDLPLPPCLELPDEQCS